MEGSSKLLEGRMVEKILGNIKKEDANKKCCDCQKPGPTYVNLTINSFVCPSCAGVLREFSFKIKGLSTSKFTSEEVDALKNSGGNERANRIWMGTKKMSAYDIQQMSDGAFARNLLNQKYNLKMFYDNDEAMKPYEPPKSSHTRTGSNISLGSAGGGGGGGGGGDLFLDLGNSSPPATGASLSASSLGAAPQSGRSRSRSRAGSGAIAAPLPTSGRTRAGSESKPLSGLRNGVSADQDFDLNDNENDDDDEEDETKNLSFAEKEALQRRKLRAAIEKFYKKHNPPKIADIDLFVEWALYHGVKAYNDKLLEKYHVGLDMKFGPANTIRRSRAQSKEALPGMRVTSSPKPSTRKGASSNADEDSLIGDLLPPATTSSAPSSNIMNSFENDFAGLSFGSPQVPSRTTQPGTMAVPISSLPANYNTLQFGSPNQSPIFMNGMQQQQQQQQPQAFVNTNHFIPTPTLPSSSSKIMTTQQPSFAAIPSLVVPDPKMMMPKVNSNATQTTNPNPFDFF